MHESASNSVQAQQEDERPQPAATGHEKHCFVVMPSGREASEQKWFKGWFEVVIKPAVKEAGYEPILAAAEEQPGAINDEIRTHLAVDPMVVVDLGGAEPEDDPNPNVMYELGIRHALSLPLVMTAWKGQRLPFDVGNQRVIMEDRELIDLDLNRKKIVAFIRAAEQGKYYRPMDAVSRLTTIQAASESLGEDSLLRALALEVRELKSTLTSAIHPREFRKLQDKKATVKRVLLGKVFRKELYPHFLASGGKAQWWPKLVKKQLSPEERDLYEKWGVEEWKAFVAAAAKELSALSENADGGFQADLLDKIRAALPAQPWPDGIHREVAKQLDLSPQVVSAYITELIRRGDFVRQVDGVLYPEPNVDGEAQ